MNRINQLFSTKQKDILSIYFCAGFPTLEGTASTIKVLEKKGINMIEIGIPFSDPMADGPVIQHAATRALKNGMTLKLLFDQLKDIRKEVQIPLVLMGYLNPIMQYGFKDFCRTCRETGIDGVIIPDLPFKDYMEEYRSIAEEQDVRIIMLITPADATRHTQTAAAVERIKMFLFLFCSATYLSLRSSKSFTISSRFFINKALLFKTRLQRLLRAVEQIFYLSVTLFHGGRRFFVGKTLEKHKPKHGSVIFRKIGKCAVNNYFSFFLYIAVFEIVLRAQQIFHIVKGRIVHF